MSDKDSTDLSDSDDNYDDIDNYIQDKNKTYQLQFIKEDYYKFILVGYFKKEENIEIELTKFEHEDYYCVINSNFTNITEEFKNGIYLYDLITMNVLKKDGKNYKIILCVEIENPVLDADNKGNLMIWLEYESNRIPLKTNLTHPGNEKIPYYIINELKNDKINEIINK